MIKTCANETCKQQYKTKDSRQKSCSKECADARRRKAITGPVDPPVPAIPDGYFVKKVSSKVDESGALIEQWIDAPLQQEAGTLVDQIPEGHQVRGVSTLVSGDGHTLVQWVKTSKQDETKLQVLERLMKDLPKKIPARDAKIKSPQFLKKADDLLAVYPMGDPHIGMLSWAPETGNDFDLDKARKIMSAAMQDLVGRGQPASTALVVNLGDFFHADNDTNRTARSGHILDVDGRWTKVLQTGIDIMVFMIDQALLHHRNVKVINEIGNHDDHSAIFLSVALNAYYRKEPRVEIDMSPSRFHWHRFGKNLIGVTHGHQQKHENLEAIMAAERPQDWGETLHRFWYCGHIHHIVKKEMRGCVIESFRTLTPVDSWAASVGYKAGRDMNRIVLHRDYGEIGREVVNASYLQAKYQHE